MYILCVLYVCTFNSQQRLLSSVCFFYRSFSYTNEFVDAKLGPISTPTVIKFSSKGVVQQTWGAGLFYLPHSLTVDHRGYIWVTDVAMHQVSCR